MAAVAVSIPRLNGKDSATKSRPRKQVDRKSSLPDIPSPKSATSKSVCRQNPPRCRSRDERQPFVRDVSPLVARKQQEERVNRICSRSATVPVRKKDAHLVGTRSPQAVKKLEPINHKSAPKSMEDTDATKSGIERVGYRLRKASKLPTIQLSCPSIIITDTDSMPAIEKAKYCTAISKSASEPELSTSTGNSSN